jgi:hypothetical protein
MSNPVNAQPVQPQARARAGRAMFPKGLRSCGTMCRRIARNLRRRNEESLNPIRASGQEANIDDFTST